MQPIAMSAERYLQICGHLSEAGWHPVGQFGAMLFLRNGKRYDLSAADLSQLDRIEREGLFVVE